MCGGGIVKKLFSTGEDIGAALLGNAAGGPLGAAAAEGLTNKLQGDSNSQALIGAATAGVGSGISDLASGSSLAGNGISGITDSINNGYTSLSDYISNAVNGTGNAATGATSPAITSQFANAGDSGSAAITAPTAGTGGAGVAGGDFGSSLNSDFGITPSATAGTAATAGSSPAVPIPQGGFLSPASGNAINQAVGGSGSAAAPSTGIMSTIQNALKGTGSSLGTLGQVAAGGSILKNLLAPAPKGTNELESAGSSALTAESQLIGDEASGKLPPGQQATIDQQVSDVQNAIRSKYASLGLTGSTEEQQALQAASDQGVQLSTQAASQATQTGLNALGATNSIYSTLLQSILGNNTNLSSAISTLSGAPKSINLGGTQVTVPTQ